jgi:hypothetical protein
MRGQRHELLQASRAVPAEETTTSPKEATSMTSAVSPNHERDGVIAWRRTQLVRSGFPEEAAAGVADDDRYDLHRLVELVERGCPPELALRILAPLEEDEAW